jgi:hypothetical protein
MPKTGDEGVLTSLLLPRLPTGFTDKFTLVFDPEEPLKVSKTLRNGFELLLQDIEKFQEIFLNILLIIGILKGLGPSVFQVCNSLFF